MISIKNEANEQEIKYPCVMKSRSSGTIVFFEEKYKGQVIYATNEHNKLGFILYDWNMSHFSPFNGQITLSNDELSNKN